MGRTHTHTHTHSVVACVNVWVLGVSMLTWRWMLSKSVGATEKRIVLSRANNTACSPAQRAISSYAALYNNSVERSTVSRFQQLQLSTQNTPDPHSPRQGWQRSHGTNRSHTQLRFHWTYLGIDPLVERPKYEKLHNRYVRK